MFSNPFLEEEPHTPSISASTHLDASAMFGSSRPRIEAVSPTPGTPGTASTRIDAGSLFADAGVDIERAPAPPAPLSGEDKRPVLSEPKKEASEWEEVTEEVFYAPAPPAPPAPKPERLEEEAPAAPPVRRKFPRRGASTPTPTARKEGITEHTRARKALPALAAAPPPAAAPVPVIQKKEETLPALATTDAIEHIEEETLPALLTEPDEEKVEYFTPPVLVKRAPEPAAAPVWEEVEEEAPVVPAAPVEEPAAPAPKKRLRKDSPTVATVRVKPVTPRKKTSQYDDGKVGLKLQQRDLEIFDFLARHRFAKVEQIARYTCSSSGAIKTRLGTLKNAEFVNNAVRGGHNVWVARQLALDWVESDLKPVSPSKITVSSLPHELGLAAIAANLGSYETNEERAEQYKLQQVNVLHEEGFPFYNRYASDEDGDATLLGETCFTTGEMRSQAKKMELAYGGRAGAMRERAALLAAATPGARSPETLSHNAWAFFMWSQDFTDHPIDLVVSRNRNADGSPESIAIELELNHKPTDTWIKILKNFREYIAAGLLKQVVYFTDKKGVAEGLKKANESVGLYDEQLRILRYFPTKAAGADEDPAGWEGK